MDILDTVQANYPTVNAAAGEFLTKLSGTGIVKDIALSAEMAGLMLLRASAADLQNLPCGSAIIGAISDRAFSDLTRFVFGFASSNGLDLKGFDIALVPADARCYLTELTQFESAFCDLCSRHGIQTDLFPYTAAAAAGKLVLAGNQLGLLNANAGLALALFHITLGGKTVPSPPTGG